MPEGGSQSGLPTVSEHYERHLAECYGWMVGGPEAAIARGDAELIRLDVPAAASGRALDLGAGFGTHAIPLAERGFQVTAVDGSAALLSQLRSLDPERRVRIVEGELLETLGGAESVELLLCMGDTLTHLADWASVERLIELAAERLRLGGRLLLTFRDYSTMAEGELRAFTVRADDMRIATCLVEREGDRVRVTDLLHERTKDGWSPRASRYLKLCLDPAAIEDRLGRAGLTATRVDGPMVTLIGAQERTA